MSNTGRSITMAPDGDAVSVALCNTSSGGKASVWKHSPAGILRWQYLLTEAENPVVAGGGLDAAGNIYVALSAGSDIIVFKLNPDGSQAWRKSWDGGANASESASAICVTASGDVYVSGTGGGVNGLDLILLKYLSSGTLLWSRRYDGPVHGATREPASLPFPAGDAL